MNLFPIASPTSKPFSLSPNLISVFDSHKFQIKSAFSMGSNQNCDLEILLYNTF